MKSILTALTFLTQPLLATVIVNDAALGIAFPFPGDYRLALTQSIPSGQGAFFVTFDNLGGGNFGFNSHDIYSIAEENRLYLAPIGTRFDAQYANSHAPFFTNAAPANWTVSIPLNTDLAIAYWDNQSFAAPTPTSGNHYGWVLLHNAPTGLVATSGATALSDGIIVGTTTQVPEPSTAALVFVGIASMALRRVRDDQIA